MIKKKEIYKNNYVWLKMECLFKEKFVRRKRRKAAVIFYTMEKY